MHRLRPFILVLCLVLVLFACRTAPILRPHSEGPWRLSMEEMAQSIERAASTRGWVTTREGPGRIGAVIVVRDRHRAEIVIAYSTDNYSIEYRRSENLLADEDQIHRNYNRWVSELDAAIQQELRQQAAGSSSSR